MEEIKLWESNDKFTFLNNIEEVIDAIKNNKLKMCFDLKDKFIPGEEITSMFDNYASKRNCLFTYTDINHPVAISEYQIFINPTFFKQYEDIIKKEFINQVINNPKQTYSIEKEIFTDQLLEELLKIPDVSLYLYNVDLTNDQINKIKEKFINCYVKKDGKLNQISSRYIFSYYTKDALEQSNNILVSVDDLVESDFNNLKFLKENSIISINIQSEEKMTDEEKISILKDRLLQIDNLNKNFIVKFTIDKRSIFNKFFKDIKFNNIDLVINNDYYDYPYEEYLKEEEKLDELVKDIKDKNLSPMEKYLYVYNIVKNYKPYKENHEDKDQSRYLRYIIDNEYMVCVGYANLLVTLLDKVGINAIEVSIGTDISYDHGYTQEEKTVEIAGHKRAIVSIDDDKYNIHGLYITDPTWDNDLDKNYLNHALLPFDRLQTEKRMFEYNLYEPILDIHNFNEYNDQINFLIKRELKFQEKHNIYKNYPFSKKICIAYHDVAKKIFKTLKCDPNYQTFLNNLNECKIEQDYINFYTKLGNYLITRINNPINEESLFQINKELLIKLQKENIDSIDKETRNDYYELDNTQFPYEIPNDSEFNLEDRKTR